MAKKTAMNTSIDDKLKWLNKEINRIDTRLSIGVDKLGLSEYDRLIKQHDDKMNRIRNILHNMW
jgi:hypothetical protein